MNIRSKNLNLNHHLISIEHGKTYLNKDQVIINCIVIIQRIQLARFFDSTAKIFSTIRATCIIQLDQRQ
jgi:hypothetical protein